MHTHEHIRFHIDFASDSRINGWSVDLITQSRPFNLRLRLADGVFFEVPMDSAILRTDVCKQFDLPMHVETGFEINLLNLANNRCHDYALFVDKSELWSFARYKAALEEQSPFFPEVKLIRQYGGRQIVVVYRKESWLHRQIHRIHAWNEVYFQKNYHSGVSFIFLEIDQIAEVKKELLERESTGLLIIERQIYRSLISISPTLANSWPTLVLDERIDKSRDFSGLLSTLCSLTGLSNDTLIGPQELLLLLTASSSYSDMMFDRNTALYTLHSGTPQHWMSHCLRDQIQERFTEDILILSKQTLTRLSDIHSDTSAVFVRTSALCFLLDLLDQNSENLLYAAFKRGLKIKAIIKDEI